MAMICTNGSRECDGCMKCYEEREPIRCPICDAVLEPYDTIYYSDKVSEIVGCEHCITERQAD